MAEYTNLAAIGHIAGTRIAPIPEDEATPEKTTEPEQGKQPWEPTAKSRRCYHRVIAGVERGGELRFLTLTSGPDSPDTCQKSWRALYMRLKRRGLITGYIKVPERSKSGKQHLHILIRGKYISQAYISQAWQEIHHAKVIDIRRTRAKSRRALAAYMAKYLSKDSTYRYSWSWEWVWRGFVRDWTDLKRRVRELDEYGEIDFRRVLLFCWKSMLKMGPAPGLDWLESQGLPR